MRRTNDFTITKKSAFFEINHQTNSIQISAKKFSFGKNIVWGKNIKICNSDTSPMDTLIIGDNVVISGDSNIMVPQFELGDYTKVNNHFYAYGTHPLKIGYNCWIGSLVVLDTLGGLIIGNNVGIGSEAQIYSHAKFGDTLYGCRVNSYTPISIGDDAWIAPNATITSASMADKSMLLAGSVLTEATKENHMYAGVPAIDVTKKIGTQFVTDLDYYVILAKLQSYLKDFYKLHEKYRKLDAIRIEMELPSILDHKYSYFIVKTRKYIKRSSEPEVAFMKFLLPDKAKFIPF
jgi:acetyltransferase-like isoleucine patch superfamily enzyme